MLSNNLDLLLKVGDLKINTAARGIGVSEATLWNWRKGVKPSLNTLRRIALYFSETLSIPYELFDEGRALIEKDFEQILKEEGIQAQSLHIKSFKNKNLIKDTENQPHDAEFSEHEKEFIINLRRLVHRRPDIPAAENALADIIELLTMVGPGSDTHHSLVRTIRNLRQYHADMGRAIIDPEEDSKKDEGK